MWKLVVLIMCVFILGCEKKPVETSVKIFKNDVGLDNFLNEDDELIAVKYGIDNKLLRSILRDYHRMSYGFHGVQNSYENLDKNIEKEKALADPQVVSVQAALEMLSNKYQVSKDKIASVLIDEKMMEKCDRCERESR